MADIEVSSTCDSGYAVTSRIDDWELVVDAATEDGPNANQTLAATYASCYIPAFRVGANKEGHEDVGRIEIDVEADLDDDDDLSAIRFDLRVEGDLEGDLAAAVERGEDICHVHAALREDLQADIDATDGVDF